VNERQEARATVGEILPAMRADRFVAEQMQILPRSQFDRHNVTIHINGKESKPSHLVRSGDMIEVFYDRVSEPSFEPEPMELDILYEDDDVVVLNKPPGLVVHPGAGNWTGTLAQGLMHHVGSLSANADSLRPGIVHRLDKDTSGVLITAKTAASHEYLSKQFRRRTLEKKYVAIVRGTPPNSRGRISTGIARDPSNRKRFAAVSSGGKPATTEYCVIRHLEGYALVSFRPTTGRTHQIRVHARHLGCPILGDPVYARPDRTFPQAGLMLHSHSLTIRLPATGEFHTFVAPLPKRFRTVLRALWDLRSEG